MDAGRRTAAGWYDGDCGRQVDQAVNWLRTVHPEIVTIHATRRWVESGVPIYGDHKTATIASSTTGPSMPKDSFQANDIGNRILAKAIVGALTFVI